jgi:hypothetical protein
VDTIYLVEEAKSTDTICLISKELAVSISLISPTNRQKLEAQKTCDIIIHVSFVSSADYCYLSQV